MPVRPGVIEAPAARGVEAILRHRLRQSGGATQELQIGRLHSSAALDRSEQQIGVFSAPPAPSPPSTHRSSTSHVRAYAPSAIRNHAFIAVPSLFQKRDGHLALPHRAAAVPDLASPRLPRLARPRHTKPRLAIPSLPSLAEPSRAIRRQAPPRLARPCRACRATPCLTVSCPAAPGLPCPTWPGLASPRLATPRLPKHAMPGLAKPCLTRPPVPRHSSHACRAAPHPTRPCLS